MFTIITKIELEGSDSETLKHTQVGYTNDIDVTNQINEQYDSTLGMFIGENRNKLEVGSVSISSFFHHTSFVNEARLEVSSLEGLNLKEITNINQL